MSNGWTALVGELGGRPRAVPAGTTLFRQGDEIEFVLAVQAGVVHLMRHSVDGTSVVMQRAGPGAVVAEASLYAERYRCDAVVAHSAVLVALPKRLLVARLHTDSAAATAWQMRLAQAVHDARFRAEVLALRTVRERLDAWLAWHEAGLPPKGRRVGLAAELGVSPAALYRELARREPR